MISEEQTLKILERVLMDQQDPPWSEDPVRQFDEERLRAALDGSRPFSDKEKRWMLRSPSARDELRFLAEVHRAERFLQWREMAIEETLNLQVAVVVEPVSFKNDDFTLSLLPMDEDGSEWMLHLKLAPRVLRTLEGGGVRVRDDQGDTWLKGVPDSDGEVSRSWVLEGSPLDRLAGQRLHLEPA